MIGTASKSYFPSPNARPPPRDAGRGAARTKAPLDEGSHHMSRVLKKYFWGVIGDFFAFMLEGFRTPCAVSRAP